MSQDDIHTIAQKDTPEAVTVPNTLIGLVIWATGRFGPALIIALACVVGIAGFLTKVYEDLGRTNAIVLDMVRTQTSANEATASALRELSRQIEANTRSVDEAHRRAVQR